MGAVKETLFGAPSESKSETQEIPGVLSREQGAAYANQAGQLSGQPLSLQAVMNQNAQQRYQSPFRGALEARLLGQQGTPYDQSLQNALLNPQFGGLSGAEQGLVNQAYSGRQAQFNNLGIGSSPAAQAAVAAAGAPTLAALRQNRIGNLMGAQGQAFGQQQQGTQNLFAGNQAYNAANAQFIQNLLSAQGLAQSGRGQTLNSYLNLAQLGQPQVAGQSTGSKPSAFGQIDPLRFVGSLAQFNAGAPSGGGTTPYRTYQPGTDGYFA